MTATASSDDVATVLEKPSSSAEAASIESAVTPEQAMMLFEARRVWFYAVGLSVTAGIGVALAIGVGGDPISQRLHIAAVAVTAVIAAAYAITTRRAGDYRRWKVYVMVYAGLIANASGFYYYGVYSAYAGVVTFSAYAFYSGGGKNTVRGGLVISLLGHGGLGAAQLAGWIEDRGLVELPVSDGWKLAILIVFQLVMIGAVAAGILAYQTMQDVMAAHDRATRDLAMREAQLAEAHEAARAAHGPGEGRFTGQQLGRFEIGAILGRGAMGEVYAATDDKRAPCAVKVLASHLHNNPDALRRFHREARVISALAVPNIVRVLEVSPASSPVPFIAMERLTGKDLAELIKEQPVRELGEVVAIVRAVAAGLDAAHDAGVVHRDLKPANVFAAEIDGRVEWKVLDFGVSKHSDEATLTGAQLVGTPGYMAPEQAKGDSIDRRVDVYSLGVVIYRLLCGRPAIVPQDAPAMLHEVVYRMPPQPSTLATVSAQVEAVLAIALAKSVDDRFATAGELAAALAEAAANVLPDVTVERADKILRRTPWGSWIRTQTRAQTRAATVPVRR